MSYDPEPGKGSHGMLSYGSRTTTIPDLKRELKPGLVRAICRQLGIEFDDLRRM